MLLSVVISFKNEEENLPELIRRTRESLKGQCEHEMVFVNDCSTDRSLEILREHMAGGDIRIINTSRSFGHGPCLFAGLRHAKGDAVVYLDADLQDPPEMIPQMLAEFRNGYDVVLTVRKEREGEVWLKKYITKKAYRFLQHAAKNIFVENAGDFRLISRRVVDHLLALDERDGIYRGLVSWVGFRTKTIEYIRAPRYRGTSHHAFFTGVPARYFLNALVSFSNYPIYMMMAFGVLIGGLSLLTAGLMAFDAAPFPVSDKPLAILVSLQLFLLGFLFGGMGVLGLYVARIYQQVRGRPDYIIESLEGFAAKDAARPIARVIS